MAQIIKLKTIDHTVCKCTGSVIWSTTVQIREVKSAQVTREDTLFLVAHHRIFCFKVLDNDCVITKFQTSNRITDKPGHF